MLLSITDAAKILDMHPRSVRRLIASRQISAVRINRRIKIHKDALNQFIEARTIHAEV